ncbi:MFS transporter [Serratia fonticola]|uniref:MFS transporter n=1 Tax=Serratia fonticola TaxID=47917 RepID=A0AAJ1YGX8_SERFO|nr:MFS transporter [Serratia fonticola]MDQ9130033.1 MFS transporter [Serratia fonticola]
MRRSGLITIFCTCYFVVNFNISFIYPMLPALQHHFSANEHHIALLLGAFPFIAFLCNIFYGPFIDKYGKKKFILIGAAGCILSYAGSILSPNIQSLIAFRILSGFFVPMMGATIFPLIIESFEGESRLFITGIVQGAASFAQLVALPLGILSGDKIAWYFPFMLLVVILIISVTLMMMLLETEKSTTAQSINLKTYLAKYTSLICNPQVFNYILLYSLFGLSVFVVFGMYAYWLTKTGAGDSYQLAILFMFSGIAGLIASTTIGRVSRLFTYTNNMMILLLIIAIISVIFMPIFAGCIILQTLLFSLFSWVRSSINPLIFVDIYQQVDKADRGTLNGIMNASFQLATSIGGIISTACLFYSPSFWLNAVVFSGFIVLCLLLILKNKQKSVNEVTS